MILRYPGAKNRIADWIIGQFPDNYEDMVYLEPYFGSGSIFFNKKPSLIETINDLDGEIVNFFTQLRENPEELIRLICLTPWSREEYDNSFEKNEDKLEQARRTIVKSCVSRGACRLVYHNGVKFDKKYNGHRTCFIDILPDQIRFAAERLLHSKTGPVQIECKDAISLIEEYNREDVLMYLDPPYMREARNKNKIYKKEYYKKDHEKLIEVINAIKAKIIISGYESDVYNSGLNGWHKDTISSRDEANNIKNEVIWRNYTVDRGYLFEEMAI